MPDPSSLLSSLCRDLFKARSIGAPYLYVLSGTAINLWAPLLQSSTSYQATSPWEALPGEILFAPTLPLITGSRS
jgi:hypothetical protein